MCPSITVHIMSSTYRLNSSRYLVRLTVAEISHSKHFQTNSLVFSYCSLPLFGQFMRYQFSPSLHSTALLLQITFL